MVDLSTYIQENNQAQLIGIFKKKYNSLYNKIKHDWTSQHDILLVSMCGKSKDEDSKDKKVYARNMYTGPANQLLVNNLNYDKIDWIILSGGYGCMSQRSQINYYTDVIMDLTTDSLKGLSDFLKYQEDLVRFIKKGNYKHIIFTLSDTWMCTLDLEEICQATSDDCEIICFLTKNRQNDKDFKIPDKITNIKIPDSWLKKFGSGRISIHEKIAVDYINYLLEHPNTSIKRFINTVVN